MNILRVTNWVEFQHYKDRDPPWIKLYRKLLDNYAWSCLQDASKSHLVGIWMLAARHNNAIPADPKWIGARISATTPVNLQVLIAAGFLTVEQDASNMLAKCSLETETETETETATAAENRFAESTPKAEDIVPEPLRGITHEAAVRATIRASKNPRATTLDLLARVTAMPGHQAASADEIGLALHEMQATGVAFSPRALSRFIDGVRQGHSLPTRPAGQPRDWEAERQAQEEARVKRFLASEGAA